MAQGPVLVLPASLHQPEALSHVLDGLVTTWARREGYLSHLSDMPGPGKAGKAGMKERTMFREGSEAQGHPCMNRVLSFIPTLPPVVLGLELRASCLPGKRSAT